MPAGIYPRRIRTVIIPIGPSIAYVPLTRGQYALIDSDDAGWASKYNWSAHWSPKPKAFYAVRDNGRTYLHRTILGLNPGELGDHISGNSLDNRRGNLRRATSSQNVWNSRTPKRNTTGYRGVHKHKNHKNWQAAIGLYGKQLYLGTFPTPELAHAAYCEAATRLHGEFARTA